MDKIPVITVVQDMDKAVAVMREAGNWLLTSGKNPNKWWHPDSLTTDFLLRYVKPHEFYVITVDGISAAAVVLQITDTPQWNHIDGDHPKRALYIHWLCVARKFAGKGMPSRLIALAEATARDKKLRFLRVDTNADEPKLRRMYESWGFVGIAERNEGYRKTIFYQKEIE